MVIGTFGTANGSSKPTLSDLAKEYGVREGSANPKGTDVGTSGTNCPSHKTLASLAKEFGVDEKFLKRAHALDTLTRQTD